MAVGALEDGIVIRVDVARGTHAVCIAVIHGEGRVLGVVEIDLHPIGCVVAIGARRGEKLGLRGVARIAGSEVVGLVASVAIRRQGRVVVVDVAIRALSWWHRVLAS